MTEIHLYKSGEVDIKVQFPQSWNECRREDLLHIADFILLHKINLTALFKLLMQEALKAHNINGMRNAHILELISVEDMAMNYGPLTEFITNGIALTAQPVTIKGMASPEDGFANITCGEYEDAEALFMEILEQLKQYQEDTKGEFINDHLHVLCKWFAVLYRPKTEDGNAEPYIPAKAQVYNPGTQNLLLAMLWYMGCNAQLPKMFPMVFLHDGKAEPDPMAITKLIHHGAGPKNGTREQIRQMPLLEFLYDLQLEAEKEAIGK